MSTAELEERLEDVETLNRLALDGGYRLQADHAMPANNLTLVFRS